MVWMFLSVIMLNIFGNAEENLRNKKSNQLNDEMKG